MKYVLFYMARSVRLHSSSLLIPDVYNNISSATFKKHFNTDHSLYKQRSWAREQHLWRWRGKRREVWCALCLCHSATGTPCCWCWWEKYANVQFRLLCLSHVSRSWGLQQIWGGRKKEKDLLNYLLFTLASQCLLSWMLDNGISHKILLGIIW